MFKRKRTEIHVNHFELRISLCIFDECIHSVQSLSCVRLCEPMDYSMPGFPVHCQHLELAQTHVHWIIDAIHLILGRSLLLPPFKRPSIRVFLNESVLHIRWSKYWSFSLSIGPSNEYSGLTSFRIEWLDLLAVQGTLESSATTQFKGINSSVLSCHIHTWPQGKP